MIDALLARWSAALAGAFLVATAFGGPGDIDPTFNPGTGSEGHVTGAINALAVGENDKVLIGGVFTNYNGQPAPYFARVNSDGSLDTAFMTTLAGNFDSEVNDIVVQPDGKILVGGTFLWFNGAQALGIARLNPDGTRDTGFTAGISGSPLRYVHSIALQADGKVIVGGGFTTANGVFRRNIARFNDNGTLDPTFVPGIANANSVVNDVAVQPDGRILVAGGFTNWAGVRVPGLARLYPDGSFDYSFAPTFPNVADVDVIKIQDDGKILAGGNIISDFGSNGVSRFLIRLNIDGSEDLPFVVTGDGWAGGVLEQQPDGKILVGGIFTEVNGTSRGSLARLNLNGTVDTGFVTTPYAPRGSNLTHIYSVAPTSDGKLMVGGWFTNINGQAFSNIVRLQNDTLVGAGAVQFGATTQVRLESTNTVSIPVYRVGGNAGAVSVSYTISTGNATAGSDFVAGSGTLTWNAGQMGAQFVNVSLLQDALVEGDETVTLTLSNPQGGATLGANASATLTIQDDDSVATFLTQPSSATINAGGNVTFTSRVASASQVSFQWYFEGSPVPFNGNLPLLSLTAVQTNQAGSYYVVASNAAGFATSAVAQLTVNVPAGTVLGFSPSQLRASPVYGVGIQSDGKVVVGGAFSSSTITTSNRIGRYETNGLYDPTFSGAVNGTINALIRLPDDKLLIGGEFTQVGGVPAPRLARLNADGTLDTTFFLTNYTGNQAVYRLHQQADGKIVAGFTFGAGVRRFDSNGVPDPTWIRSAFTNSQSHITAVHQAPNGEYLIGGYTIVSFVAQYSIARLSADGALLATYTNISREANAIRSFANGDFIVGGGFNGGAYLRRFDVAGQLIATNFVSHDVQAMHLDAAGRLTVGGTFTNIDGNVVGRIARLRADGSVDPDFSTGLGANGSIYTFHEAANGDLWVGGGFNNFNGQSRLGVARLLGGPAVLVFGTNNIAVFENTGSIVVPLRRVSGSKGAVSVTVTSSDAQGAAGGRYAVVNEIVTWAESDVADKFVTIPLLNNASADGDVNVTLQLSSPTGSSTLGLQTSLNITIYDDEAAPVITTQPVSAVANVGGSASFSVEARSATALSYQWQRNGTNIANATNATLVISNVTNTLAGAYTVIVSNSGGSATSLPAQLVVVPAAGRAITNAYVANFNGTVKAITPLTSGQVLVAGHFTTVSNYGHIGVARLRADGLVDATFVPTWSQQNIRAEAVAPLTNNGVIAGGAFSTGFTTNYLRGFSSNGAAINAINNLSLNGMVRALVAEPDGRVLVGGAFTLIGGNTQARLSRLTSAGGVVFMNLGSGFNGEVWAIARQNDGKILVGGAFTTFDGQPARHIVRLNSDGTRDNTFNAGTGPSTNVFAIAVLNDGRIAIGGDFTSVNGTNRARLAVLNSNGSLDLTFNPSAGPDQTVRALLAQPDGDVIAAGNFLNANGVARTRIARFNADGSFDAGFNAEPGFNNTVFALAAAADGGVYAGGDFTQLQNRNVSQFAKLHGNVGPLPQPIIYSEPQDLTVNLNTSASFSVFALSSLPMQFQWFKDGVALSNATSATLAIAPVAYSNAGNYSVEVRTAGGTTTSRSAVLNVLAPPYVLDTNALGGLIVDSWVNVIAPANDGGVFLGGSFWMAGGIESKFLARLTPQYSVDTAFVSMFTNWSNPDIRGIHQRADGNVVVAGSLLNAGARSNLVRVTATGAHDPSFANSFSNSGSLRVLLPEGNGYLVGGTFTTVGDTARANFARVDASGNSDATFNAGSGGNGSVNAIVKDTDGHIVIGGGFTTFNGGTWRRLARFNSDGTIDSSFNIGTGFGNGEVRVLAVQADGKIIAGGTFTSFNGQNVSRLIRIETNGAIDATFNVGSGASNSVNAIAIDAEGRILVAGDFTGFNGRVAGGLVRLNTNGTFDTFFNIGTGFNSGVNALHLQADGSILAGGFFTQFSGKSAWYFARIYVPSTATAPTISQQPSSVIVNVGTNASFSVTAAGQNLTYQWRKDGIALTNGARVTGATSAQLTITGATRADAGAYSVVVTSADLSTTSSNATLSVRVPQVMTSPQLVNGYFQLRFNDNGGGVATSNDLARIQVQFSTNLPTWHPLPGALQIVNGVLQFTDTNPPAPLRFYRVIEQ